MSKLKTIYAIIGIGFPSYLLADKYTALGYCSFTGNQWNERWDWHFKALEKLSEDQLDEIFNELLEAKIDLHEKLMLAGVKAYE